MILPDKTGIYCDFCGLIYSKKFLYYSITTLKCRVENNIRISREPYDFNKDMCQNCYDDTINNVKLNIVKKPKKMHIKCDLSKEFRTGTFDYYVLYFDKVDVDEAREPHAAVDNKVMDLNVINGFDKLVSKTEVIKNKMIKQGNWA